MNDYQQQKAMRNGKYKAFYLNERQFDKVNGILKECQDLTVKQINELYPGTKKVLININGIFKSIAPLAPPLKPNQPNHKIKAPKAAIGVLLP